MKNWHIKLALVSLFLLGGQAWASGSSHHGGHGGGHYSGGHRGGHYSGGHGGGHRSVDTHVGVYFGPSFGYDTHYLSPFYYPHAPLVVAPPPTVYIERGNPQSVAQPYYWYYCANPEGYYPYVQRCPGGWQQVAPHPPS